MKFNKNNIPINKTLFFRDEQRTDKTLLNAYELNFIDYLMSIYGGNYCVKNGVLFIENEIDIFRINLNDGARFGVYTVFHKNKWTLNNVNTYHKQMKTRNLEYGIFICFTHAFNKSNGIFNGYNDFIKIKESVSKTDIVYEIFVKD